MKIQQTELERLEEKIIKGFFEAGSALAEIRDRRLYKNKYSSFESYCRERWNMTRQTANRYIQAVEVSEELEPIGFSPTRESQCRPLAEQLDNADDRREAWANAIALAPNNNPTAREVEAAIARVVERKQGLQPGAIVSIVAGPARGKTATIERIEDNHKIYCQALQFPVLAGEVELSKPSPNPAIDRKLSSREKLELYRSLLSRVYANALEGRPIPLNLKDAIEQALEL